MENQILKDVNPQERIETLKANSFAVEKFTFSRELDQGEVQELQGGLSQKLIKVDQEDQKLKIAKEAYKSVVKPIKEEIKGSLQKIRSQMEEVTEEVYLMKDYEENKVGFYSKDGKLVFERNMKEEEKQYSINEHLRKTGTDEK